MPSDTGEHANVAAPVGRPPFLAFIHQRAKVVFQALDVELFEFFAVVEILAQRVGFDVVLMEDVEIQCIRPPIHDRGAQCGHTAMHDRAFPCCVFSVHFSLSRNGWLFLLS